MGRIIVSVLLRNTLEPSKQIRFDAFVDTGAGWLTLPMAWRDRLGALPVIRTEQRETADQAE